MEMLQIQQESMHYTINSSDSQQAKESKDNSKAPQDIHAMDHSLKGLGRPMALKN